MINTKFISLGNLHLDSVRDCITCAVLLSFVLCTGTALANGIGENNGWQFKSTADKVNQAISQEMIQKRNSGYYAAPVYNTNIARQFNCNVTANSTGTQGTNSTVANSPSTSGAIASSAGSTSTSASDVASTGSSTSASSQTNNGTVGAGVNGSTNTSVQGSATQALNSNQTNSGTQAASVGTSSACMFGAIN